MIIMKHVICFLLVQHSMLCNNVIYYRLTLRPLFKVDNKELLVKNRECILNL